MNGEIILCAALALAAFALGGTQLAEKGKPLNNAWLYASKEEREKTDVRPLFRQSGICFLLLGVIFTLLVVYALSKTAGWLYAGFAMEAAVLVYAVVSTVLILRKNKKT